MTTCATRWCIGCTRGERWGRSTHGLSLGNLTTYPATNCIQGLTPSFFFNQRLLSCCSIVCVWEELARMQTKRGLDGLEILVLMQHCKNHIWNSRMCRKYICLQNIFIIRITIKEIIWRTIYSRTRAINLLRLQFFSFFLWKYNFCNNESLFKICD